MKDIVDIFVVEDRTASELTKSDRGLHITTIMFEDSIFHKYRNIKNYIRKFLAYYNE